MNSAEYYKALELLAKEKREIFQISETDRMSLSLMRKIYKKEGIRIDTAPRRMKKLRAAYFCEDGDYSVFISPQLPNEPKLFSLGHELKHHYVDQELLMIYCFDVNSQSNRVEIGAEVFSAEFIFPMEHFKNCLADGGITSGNCSAEDICRLKQENRIPLSYQSICKRLYRLGVVPHGTFKKIKFTKVHENIYGVPFYKRTFGYHHSQVKN